MKKRRVKITGVGLVTPAGIGKDAFLAGIQKSLSRVKTFSRASADAGVFVGAEVIGFSPEKLLAGIPVKRMPRHTQFALACAKMCIEDAQVPKEELKKTKLLISIGAALMDFGSINRGIDLILRCGAYSALPTVVSDVLVSNIGATIGEAMGLSPRVMSFQSACCSGLDSIGRAAEMIAIGEADMAICGGTEAPLYLHPMLELRSAGLSPGNLSQPERQSRPFDRWRTTGVIGEGSCILLLEPDSSPRNAYAYVSGHGFASDAESQICSGLGCAIEIALGNSGMRPSQVDVVSAWGPGHRVIDAKEASVLKQIFGACLERMPTYSIKGAIGNPLGAASAIQVGCEALCMRNDLVPPTVNWRYPDPECKLSLCEQSRYIEHKSTIINAHGLSGSNSCLVLER